MSLVNPGGPWSTDRVSQFLRRIKTYVSLHNQMSQKTKIKMIIPPLTTVKIAILKSISSFALSDRIDNDSYRPEILECPFNIKFIMYHHYCILLWTILFRNITVHL